MAGSALGGINIAASGIPVALVVVPKFCIQIGRDVYHVPSWVAFTSRWHARGELSTAGCRQLLLHFSQDDGAVGDAAMIAISLVGPSSTYDQKEFIAGLLNADGNPVVSRQRD